MSAWFSLAMDSPPVGIAWLAVVPLSIAIGRWLGEVLDLTIGFRSRGADWARLGAIGGGLFGAGFCIGVVVAL
jgi:hypothetical protein